MNRHPRKARAIKGSLFDCAQSNSAAHHQLIIKRRIRNPKSDLSFVVSFSLALVGRGGGISATLHSPFEADRTETVLTWNKGRIRMIFGVLLGKRGLGQKVREQNLS